MSEEQDLHWAIAIYSQDKIDDEESVMIQSAGELDVISIATAVFSVLHLEYGMTREEVLECFDAVAEGDINELH